MSSTVEAYKQFEEAWYRAERYLASLHCPNPVFVIIVDDGTALGWARLSTEFRIVIREYVNDNENVENLAPVTCVRTTLRIHAVDYFPQLVEAVKREASTMGCKICEATLILNKTIDQLEKENFDEFSERY